MLEMAISLSGCELWAAGRETAMKGPSVADYPQGARMRPRVIDDFEFVWMLLGQALFVT